MTPRQENRFRTSAPVEDLAATQRHAAGIDVHAAVHFVAVPAEDVPAGFLNPDANLPAVLSGHQAPLLVQSLNR